MNKPYDITTAKTLLELAFPEWEYPPYVIRDDGVYQSEEHRQASHSEEAFDWSPAYDIDGPNAPNPITAPMLPIPFGGPELAAFMLDGAGAMIPEALGCRIGGIDPNLNRFDHPRMRVVRDALRESFALLKKTLQRVGPPNYEEIDRAYRLLEQCDRKNGEANEHEGVFKKTKPGICDEERMEEICRRREKAINSVSELVACAEQENATAKQNWRDWRRQMVRALIDEAISPEVNKFLAKLEGLPKQTPVSHQTETALLKSVSYGEPEDEFPRDKASTIEECASKLAALFDPVKTEQLEAMFPADGKWAGYAEHASRNGLKKCAKVGRGLFNPYLAAEWWIKKGPKGWDWGHCSRKLANNLPPRSLDSKHLITGEYE
jgi:hypothetical protein